MVTKTLGMLLLSLFWTVLLSKTVRADEECIAAHEECTTPPTTVIEEVWCEDCDWDGLATKLECDGIHNRSVPTTDEYMTMRRAYVEVVGESDSTISPLTEDDGFMVPHRAGQAGEKGRGIFATEFIAKGTPVLNFRQVATFEDGASIRRFLSKIPRLLACDYLYWAYTEWDEQAQRHFQSVDLDDSALCNDGRNKEDQNLGCDPEGSLSHGDVGCNKYSYATKDIQPGDELMCLYSAFSSGVEGANTLGLGWSADSYDD
mmetsp:Transcript_10023/g.21148  ORF Transcript_10023/g.21148 Transcript_10023/m.21148 type:complete len:260 (-) Transcript_10023:360-1139(-)